MNSINIRIRKAEISDMPVIFNLVRELAEYEKEPHAVTADITAYNEAFNQQLIEGLIVESDGIAVGMAVYYMTFSTWKGKSLYLEDFYIQPAYRKLGIGQQLFDAFLDEARKKGVKQVKWQVLDWNELALKFYRKNHAVIETNWWNGKLFIGS
jgi:GNAT superfamily N-acetyltransferase